MEPDESKFVYYVPQHSAAPAPESAERPAQAVPAAAPSPEPEEEAVEPQPQPRFSPPAVRNLAPLPAAPAPSPAPPKAQLLRSKRMVVLGSAAAGLLILGTYLAHHNAKAKVPVRPPEVVEHLDTSELSALPEPLQAGAQALLAGTFQPPAWLPSLGQGSGGNLDYPIQEAVEELQPTLRWIYAAPSANVAVLDPAHKVVARTEVFNQNRWTLPVELQRGAIYTWEVNSTGQVSRDMFRILDETEAGWLQGLRLAHPQSHLLLGVAALELGVFSEAQSEFQALAQDHPHSPEAAQLLRTASGFRKH